MREGRAFRVIKRLYIVPHLFLLFLDIMHFLTHASCVVCVCVNSVAKRGLASTVQYTRRAVLARLLHVCRSIGVRRIQRGLVSHSINLFQVRRRVGASVT